MATGHQVRHCRRCGARLARDNDDAMCGPCQVATRGVLLRPPALPPEFWQIDQMRDALATWHMGRVILAYRTHPITAESWPGARRQLARAHPGSAQPNREWSTTRRAQQAGSLCADPRHSG